ncbi:MAG TPA: DUF3276 family protein [Bacteroidota bacterium]|jgi:hypothetical protein
MDNVDTSNENVFTKRVRAGKRTYFFDVKATKSAKDFYVIITESRRVGEEKYEKHKLFLYKEDFKKFADALTETVTHVENELLEKIGRPEESPSAVLEVGAPA